MASQSLPNQSITVPISIPQLDELNNIHAGLESVVWMCYLALCGGGPDSGDATKTARSVHSQLEPWHERLGDVLEEFAAGLAERRRERQELLKERGTGPEDIPPGRGPGSG